MSSRAVCVQLFFPREKKPKHSGRRFFLISNFWSEISSSAVCCKPAHKWLYYKVLFLCPCNILPFGRKDLTRMQPLKRYLCSLACCLVFNSKIRICCVSVELIIIRVQMLSQDTLAFLTCHRDSVRPEDFGESFQENGSIVGQNLLKKKGANLKMFSVMWLWHVTHWETAHVFYKVCVYGKITVTCFSVLL